MRFSLSFLLFTTALENRLEQLGRMSIAPKDTPRVSRSTPSHSPCADHSLSPPQIDRLSQLPPELLEDIFDLVAVPYMLCTTPPSKCLHPFHGKALYRYLIFDTFAQFQKFALTLDNLSPKVIPAPIAQPTSKLVTGIVTICLAQLATNLRKFEDFAKDSKEDAEYFEDYPTKVTLSRNGTLFIGFSHGSVDLELTKRVIFQLSLFRIEFAPSSLFSAGELSSGYK